MALTARIANYARKHAIRRRLATPSDPRTRFRGIPDDIWFWLFTHGIRDYPEVAAALPSMPSVEIQERFTGNSGDSVLNQAFAFTRHARAMVAQHGRPLTDVLDFGCGWGRIIRFWLRDVDPSRLHGVDVLQEMVDLCRQTNPYCRFSVIDPWPTIALPDASVDLVYAYSVFSHLSEPLHLAWIEDLMRLLRPAGLLVVTTRGRDFIEKCAWARTQPESLALRGAQGAFLDTAAALTTYDAGRFVYDPLPPAPGSPFDGSLYGETCVSRAYVEQHWTRFGELMDYTSDRNICDQDIITLRRHH